MWIWIVSVFCVHLTCFVVWTCHWNVVANTQSNLFPSSRVFSGLGLDSPSPVDPVDAEQKWVIIATLENLCRLIRMLSLAKKNDSSHHKLAKTSIFATKLHWDHNTFSLLWNYILFLLYTCFSINLVAVYNATHLFEESHIALSILHTSFQHPHGVLPGPTFSPISCWPFLVQMLMERN